LEPDRGLQAKCQHSENVYVSERKGTYIVEHGEEASDNARAKYGRSPYIPVLEYAEWERCMVSTAILNEDEY
jgi:hypothetical protein